jgi:hypothetical protein
MSTSFHGGKLRARPWRFQAEYLMAADSIPRLLADAFY